MICPVRLGVSPTAATPQVFSIRGFMALFPHTGTLSFVVCLAPQLFLPVYPHTNVGLSALPATSLPSPPAATVLHVLCPGSLSLSLLLVWILFFLAIFCFNFSIILLLFNYNCLHFLLTPLFHPSQTHLPPLSGGFNAAPRSATDEEKDYQGMICLGRKGGCFSQRRRAHFACG